MLVRIRPFIVFMSIVALSGALVVPRVTADSSGASATQADGSPTQIAALTRYVDASETHTCVVLNDATLKCFGSNASGQIGSGGTAALGDGPTEMGDLLAAVRLGTGRSVRAVSTGKDHTCALIDDGSVKCFGRGDNGQLASGSTLNIGRSASSMGDALAAVNLGTGRSAKAVATGAAHTCAILDDDTVKCWGLNDAGQLGLGDVDSRGDAAGEMGDSLPVVQLGLAPGVRVTAISAGSAHTCALLSSGAVKCWGFAASGRLGIGDDNSRGDEPGEMGSSLPTVNLGSGRTAKAISAGADHTCAIRDTNDVVCWGVGATGRLGTGAEDDIGDGAGEMGNALVPVPLGSGRTAVAVSAGDAHTCVVLDNGAAKCWGAGANGRLGVGSQDNLGDQPNELGDSLAALSLGTGRTVRAIAAGAAHTCVVLDDATLKCFGLGTSGRLGSGATATLGTSPSQMGDNLTAVNLGTDRRVMSLAEPGRAGAPTGTAGDGTVSLTWATPNSNGGSAIVDYLVEYSSDGTSWVTVADGISSATSATVSGLTNATSYRFRVTARNAIGDGVPSTSSDVITPTAPTTTTTTTTTTITTTTTTTTVPPTTTTTSTTSTTSTTTTVAPTATTTTTTTIAPTTTTTIAPTTTAPASSGGNEPAASTPAATPPTPTTTTIAPTSTTTIAPTTTTTIAPTTTTTVAPTTTISPTTVVPPTTAPTASTNLTRSLVLRPFAPLSATLSAAQRRQIAAFAATLSPADVVTCVGGAGSGPVRLLRDVARLRATTVCNALAQRVPGVKTTIDIALSGEIQIADQSQHSNSQVAAQAAAPAQQSAATPPQSPAPIRVSASDLSRRVLVVARPAGLAPRRS